VRRRCFILTMSSRDSPRNFNCRFRSRTEMDTSSSSDMSMAGGGDMSSLFVEWNNNNNVVSVQAMIDWVSFWLTDLRTKPNLRWWNNFKHQS
jgi:hypothetical protein